MIFRKLFFFIFIFCSIHANAQLLQWNTFGYSGAGAPLASTSNDANISSASLSLGAGVAFAAKVNRFGGSGWFDTGDTNPTILSESVSGNDYIQFIVTPNSGYMFTATSFDFSWSHSPTGSDSLTLRSSLDGYTSDLGSFTGLPNAITAKSITLSGFSNITSAVTFRLYGYGATNSGGTGGFEVSTNAVNVVLNGSTMLSTVTSNQNGDWYVGSTWIGGIVPVSGQNVIINHAVTNVTSGAAITENLGKTITINSGGSLSTGSYTLTNNGTITVNTGATLSVGATLMNNGAVNINGTFQINAGGYANGTAFNYAASGSTLIMNHNNGSAYGISSGQAFWPTSTPPFNVTINSNSPTRLDMTVGSVSGTLTINSTATLDCNVASALTVNPSGTALVSDQLKVSVSGGFNSNGILQLNGGGYVSTNAPKYANTSTLVYNSNYGVSTEWTANGTTAGTGIPQNVTIQNSATVTMPNSSRGLAGNLLISSGNLTLSTTSGADLQLGGNWTRVSTASFTHNNRTVYFSSATTQTVTVSGTGTETFYGLNIQGSGTLKLATGTNILVTGLNGLGLTSSNATSTLDLNGQTLTLSGGGNLGWSSGARLITSSAAGGVFAITSGVTISLGGAGTLSTDANTIVNLKNSFNLNNYALTINGTAQMDSGGFFATNSPIYGGASTLSYISGGIFNRGFEWLALGVGAIGTTPGYPNNVQISNNTTLNYNNGTPLAKAVNGNLTIASGSTFDMANGTPSSTGDLTIAGTVTNNGTFTFANVVSSVVVIGDFTNNGTVTLGSVLGADLKIKSNFINTATFNGNSRAVFFTRTGTQTVSSTTALTIPFVVTSGGGTTVQLLSDLVISSSSMGTNVISFGSASDVIDINGKNLTIGSSSNPGTISGTGTFKGSTSSNLTLLGTGSIGTLTFSSNLNLGTFTINRTAGSVACVMGSALTINSASGLVLTAGIVDLANTAMTIGASSTISGGSSSNYVIADVANGSTASLLKTFSAAGTFAFPIGDSAGSADGSQYTPISVTFTGGSYGGYAGFAIDDIKEPNMDATANYITRYWSMFSSGITPTSYSVTGTYLPIDIVGTETSSQSNQWNGTAWTNGGTAIGSNTMTKTGNTTLPATNHFTGGARDPEINIQQASTNYLTASTYNFGTVTTTIPSSITFTIQNLGSQTLTLSTATFSGSPNYTYTTAYASSVSGLGTTTFVVTFNPSGAGTFTGSISIPNNDTSGSENPYVINFTGVGQLPAPEINIRAASGGFGNITSGNVSTTNGLQNTAFGSVNLGSSITKDFEIQNLGTSTLTLTGTPLVSIGGTNPGDFVVTTVPSTSSIVASASTTFIITFTPSFVGTRSAIVSVANNDSDENPYTFLINGTGVCLTTGNTITPTSGPVGTEVTITATTNNLTGSTVTFNGTNATPVTTVSSTQIKVNVPSGATNGNLVTTNSQGCTATNAFTVISTLAQPCEGGYSPTDLFISEFTDSNNGSLSYVEIYNGTGVTKNMSNYSLKTANNGGAYSFTLALNNVNLASGSTYVVALGNDSACGADTYSAQGTGGGSVNFATNGNDHVGLFNGITQIDSWGIFGDNAWAASLGIGQEGADFRRKTTVVAPNTTYSNSDWTIADYAGTVCGNNDYSNIGIYSLTSAATPTVTQHPTYTPTCKATSLTVAGTEGFSGGNALAYQWYAVAPNTATWTALTNTGVYSGSTAATLSISDISGLTGYQFYCQIRENSATCYSASNAVIITPGQSTTWNGTSWSNSTPDINMAVTINGNYNTLTNGSFEACSVTVNNGFILDIKSGNYVSINNDLTVNTGATLVVENNGSLVMINDNGVVTNNGTTQVIRTTTPYERYDYTYWSSPVNNASILSTFIGWRTDYSFQFTTPNFSDIRTINSTVGDIAGSDSFDDYAPWAWQAYTGTMTNGKGYAIMGPTSVAFTPTATSTVTFSGSVNNGVISIPVVESGNVSNTTDDYNLIGNPYPSSLFANTFIMANGTKTSGTLYFWTHVGDISVSNPGPDTYNFISDDYAMYNLSGGTKSGTNSSVPSGYVASGQGFFVEAQGSNTLTFNNAMRNKTYLNSNFYRTSNTSLEKDRIWLNLQNADGMFGQQLIAYFDEASLDFDWAYDGRVNQSNNYVSFYSIAGVEKYKIQARPAFNDSDIVPLGYFSAVSGAFTISIDQKEGVLDADYTSIYLEDLDMNIIHDLKQSPYAFTTNSGRFENRFLLRYTNDSALNTPDFDTLNNSVFVYTNHGEMTIKSPIENIDSVSVYDVLGRRLFEADEIQSNEFITSNITMSQQTLIVKIKLTNGTLITRKIIL